MKQPRRGRQGDRKEGIQLAHLLFVFTPISKEFNPYPYPLLFIREGEGRKEVTTPPPGSTLHPRLHKYRRIFTPPG